MHALQSFLLLIIVVFRAGGCRAVNAGEREAAREIREGYILLGEMSCTACHAATEKELAWISPKASPRLADIGTRANPDWVRRHLLSPRDAMPGTMMPDVLYTLPAPERDAAADALTHFLFSASASKWKRVAPDKGAVARGESVFHRVGCVACHAPQNGTVAGDASVPLPRMTEKWSLDGLRRFLLDPLVSRPSGRMPAMGLTDGEAFDAAHYLLRETKVYSPLEVAVFRGRIRSLDDLDTAEVASTTPVQSFSLAVPGAGGRLQLRFSGWLRVDAAGDYAFHLNATDGAARIALDDRWIEDERCWERDRTNANGTLHLEAGWHRLKLDFVQRGSKPPTLLVEWEGRGIVREPIPAARLRADREVEPSGEPAPFVVDAVKAARGKVLFAELNCAACHERKVPVKPLPSLAAAQVTRGCLAGKPAAGAPDFHFSEVQRAAVQMALGDLNRSAPAAPSPQQRVAHTMETFRCAACHKRDGVGGVSKERDAFFTSNVDDLGDEGRLPPSLDGVGDRLRAEWLVKVLGQGASVRPYLNVRMPQFGAANAGHLAELFVALDRHAQPIMTSGDAPDVQREAGRRLVGTDGLSCIACHRFARQPAHALHVMDLTTTTERLNEDWFRAFLRDPNRFHPATRMPAFWPSGVSVIPAVLGGDTDRQHAALWTYLADGARAKFPEGLSRKNMELVVGGEAVVYRGKLWEAGFRAIATGFPGQVNAAFDAEEMRLALLWRGRFLDASAHWSVQGMGSIHPLARDPIVFPHGAAFAVLADANAQWPAVPGKEAGMQFRGYQLDALRRPTLLYAFREIAVEDFLANAGTEGNASLHRTMKFSGPPLDGFHFRLAVGRLTPAGENAWRLDDALTLRVLAGGKAFTRGEGARQELLVPLRIEDSKAQLEIEYAW